MFEQKRFSDNGTSAARHEKFGDRGDEMDKQHDQVAHADIVPISTNATRLGTVWHLCDKSGIRHRQVYVIEAAYRSDNSRIPAQITYLAIRIRNS